MKASNHAKKLLFVLLGLTAALVLIFTSCATPTPQIIEKIVTEIVKETVVVKEEGKEVVKTVEKVVEKVVEVEVTPTPDTSELGVLKNVPRNRTLVLGAWEFQSQLVGTDNWNPILNRAAIRTNYGKFVFEPLYYANLNTGEEYPWLAESYELDEDYMGFTAILRKGVEWADGEPFTCDDVKFTIEAMRDTDAARWKGLFTTWVDSVECIDDFTVRVNYTKTNPRFHQRFMVGHENGFVIVPEHIFAGKDVGTFTNLDLGAGNPVGTGPYKLVLVTPNQVIFDRRDDWWGAKIGFQDLPAPERIVGTNAASDEAYAQLYMTNKLDYGGFALQVGSFEAAKEKNPSIRSWNKEGPVYGAPDGCVYQLSLNNAKYDDVNVRLAINYAIDRQEVADLAYQGATHPLVLPVSSYVMGAWGPILNPIIEKYNRDAPSQDMVDKYMGEAGYEKNGDGIWEKDGEVASMIINVPQPWAPLGPVLAEQLTRAGFQAEEQLDAGGQWASLLQTGEADATAFVHCGSLNDPYETLSQFHSKYNLPMGETDNNGGGIFAYTRYPGDDRLDALLDQMEANVPSTTNPEYVAWVEEATDIYLRDMPTIVLTEELHVVTMNENYWTGFPTSDDPYIAPYPCWLDFTLAVYHLEPTQ